MRDHVVHVAGDLRALLGGRRPRLGRTTAAQLLGMLSQLEDQLVARPHHTTDDPEAAHERDDERGVLEHVAGRTPAGVANHGHQEQQGEDRSPSRRVRSDRVAADQQPEEDTGTLVGPGDGGLGRDQRQDRQPHCQWESSAHGQWRDLQQRPRDNCPLTSGPKAIGEALHRCNGGHRGSEAEVKPVLATETTGHRPRAFEHLPTVGPTWRPGIIVGADIWVCFLIVSTYQVERRCGRSPAAQFLAWRSRLAPRRSPCPIERQPILAWRGRAQSHSSR